MLLNYEYLKTLVQNLQLILSYICTKKDKLMYPIILSTQL